jgi:hypothetical protein
LNEFIAKIEKSHVILGILIDLCVAILNQTLSQEVYYPKMEIKDLLKLYENDPIFQIVAEKTKTQQHTQIKGLVGSLDAFCVAAVAANLGQQPYLIILNDKEDAAYFFNDLQNLIGEESVFFFPMSYKKPYQYQDIENANVLQRSEILNLLTNPAETTAQFIVS